MAKMALSDGEVAAEERAMLRDLVDGEEALDALLAKAKEAALDDLLAQVESYADGFFIALRAYAMAMVDNDFDVREEALFNKLVDRLKITDEDRALIERSEKAAQSNTPPEPRVMELYESSSFKGA